MTNEYANQALLPVGISDVLPLEAAFEATALEQLISNFASFGYERVQTPLIEFESSLLSGLGADMGSQTFRLMDPISQRMMGLRADMTPQVARVAATRLKNTPRPLRLSYSGPVLRVKGNQLHPERQFTQVGAELIGVSETSADIEVIVMAWKSLTGLGIKNASVDLCMPTLVPAVCEDFNISDETRARLRQSLNSKDAAEVAALAGDLGEKASVILSALLASAGPASKTLDVLNALDFGPKASLIREILADVISRLIQNAPELVITVDPVENRGFEYHSGVTFTFFARGIRGELGHGGRYLTAVASQTPEPSTGFTLFMDTILRASPRPEKKARMYIPMDTPEELTSKLRGEGWITVGGLSHIDDPRVEAVRLQCSHYLLNGELKTI